MAAMCLYGNSDSLCQFFATFDSFVRGVGVYCKSVGLYCGPYVFMHSDFPETSPSMEKIPRRNQIAAPLQRAYTHRNGTSTLSAVYIARYYLSSAVYAQPTLRGHAEC